MDIVKELEKFCDYAIEVGYLEETDKSPLINIYMAHFYNSMSDCERQPVTDNKQTQEQKFYPCAVELLSEGTETCVDECLDPENCKFLRADATSR